MPDWAQDIAAITTVIAAAVWLVLRWLRIGKPRAAQPGCARCEHNVLAPQPEPAGTARGGVRSSRLRVLR
ncbi:MAG TPA: hypothetical protein VM869_11920 [Enhygromyxa sp.]|nr:hypothetical protein [Enhygromyxa sp.]